jgi:two-component system CheB/CheR fusion protein
VSAVISQTLKRSSSPQEFSAAIQGRIAALARAHSLLTQSGGRDEVLLRDLLVAELAPYDRRENKTVLAGPDVALMPKAGLTIGMVIHELASNAVKYGGLSTPGGQLSVEWKIVVETSRCTLRIIWTESGGPAVKVPSRSGFGTSLIERSLVQDLDGTVAREFLSSGLKCTIAFPLTDEVGRSPGQRSKSS